MLRIKQQEVKDDWAAGAFTSAEAYATVQLNAEAIGKTTLIDELLNMEYERFVEDLVNDRE